MVIRCGGMTDRLMMDGTVVRTRSCNYGCRSNVGWGRRGGMHRGNMMVSVRVRRALVGWQGIVRGVFMGGGQVVRWRRSTVDKRVQSD